MASMQTNATMLSLTPAQLAALPPNEQAQYMRGLSPSQQAIVAQEVQNAAVTQNRQFMRKSVEKIAYCPVTGGSGVYAAYSHPSLLAEGLGPAYRLWKRPEKPGHCRGQ